MSQSTTQLKDPAVSPTPTATQPFGAMELHMPKEVEEWFHSLSPSLFQNYKDIENTWNNPAVQFSVTLVNDPQFRGAVNEISHQEHPLQKLLTYELVLVVMIWILRAWRLSKAGTWLLRLWAQLWVGMLFWALSLLVIPFIAWGTAYKTVLGQGIKALIRHFL